MKTIEEIDNKIESLYNEIETLKEERYALEESSRPKLEGKYWRMCVTLDSVYYIKVRNFFLNCDRYIISGHGFKWESTKYYDACGTYWNADIGITIMPKNIDNFLKNKITEITKEEFEEAFDTMISETKENFMHFLNCDGE